MFLGLVFRCMAELNFYLWMHDDCVHWRWFSEVFLSPCSDFFFHYIIMSILITDTQHQFLSLCTKNAEIFPNFTEEFKVSWIIT